MSTTYADTFNRADTSAGSGLGTTDTGSLAWTTLTGTAWRILSNKASTTDTITTNPLCVIDISNSEADVQCDIGTGDAVYFRVVDANNWWRIRQSGVTSSGTYVGSWSAWSAWSADIQGCGTTYGSCTAGESNYVSGFATLNTDCRLSVGPCSYSYAKRTQSRTVYSYNYTTYTLTLEKCVGGSVSTVGTPVNTSTTKARALCTGSSIQWFRHDGSNWVSLGTITDSTHNTATKHGVGRGTSSVNASSIDNFVAISLVPSTPTTVTPVSAGTVNTDLPTLGATVVADVSGLLQKIEWQLATDTAFTSNVRTVTQADTELRASGPTTMVTPSSQSLFQGTWYIRARALTLGGGTASAYTAYHSFTVSHPPAAAGLSPTAGAAGAVTAGEVLLKWQFTDTSPIDTQTAYEVEIQRTSDSVVAASPGKTVTTDQTDAIPIGAEYIGVNMQWRIRLWDRDDVVGSYSNWQQFVPAYAPVVAITAPLSDITSPKITVTWTYTSDLPCSAWRVQIYNGTETLELHTTGWVSGAATSYQTPVLFDDGNDYVIKVTARDTGGLESAVMSTSQSAAWIQPNTPTVLLWDNGDTTGETKVSWDSGWNDPEIVQWTVYRRQSGESSWTAIHENYNLLSSGFYEYLDYTATPEIEWEYAVVQTANRFGDEIQSAFTANAITPHSSHYWLVFPDDPDSNLRLPSVTADQFTPEYEVSEIMIIGRGRHVDIGDRIGVRGSLTFQLRGDTELDLTAQQQYEQLQAAGARTDHVYVRTPFGDIWAVSLGNMAHTRVPGVGRHAYMDVTVPYVEVYDIPDPVQVSY